MTKQEKITMLLNLINLDDGSITKNFKNRQELRELLKKIRR